MNNFVAAKWQIGVRQNRKHNELSLVFLIGSVSVHRPILQQWASCNKTTASSYVRCKNLRLGRNPGPEISSCSLHQQTTQHNQIISRQKTQDRISTNSSLSSHSPHPSAIRISVLSSARYQLRSALKKKLPLARCSLVYIYTEPNQQSKSLHKAMNSTLENDIWCTFYQYKVVSAVIQVQHVLHSYISSSKNILIQHLTSSSTELNSYYTHKHKYTNNSPGPLENWKCFHNACIKHKTKFLIKKIPRVFTTVFNVILQIRFIERRDVTLLMKFASYRTDR